MWLKCNQNQSKSKSNELPINLSCMVVVTVKHNVISPNKVWKIFIIIKHYWTRWEKSQILSNSILWNQF